MAVGTFSLELQEQNLLKFITVEPKRLSEVKGEYFVTSTGKTIFQCLKSLSDSQVQLSPTSVAIEIGKNGIDVSEDSVKETIFDKDVTGQSFDYLYRSLKESYIRHELQETFLGDGIKLATSKETFEVGKLVKLRDHLTTYVDLWEDNSTHLYTMEQAYEEQLKAIGERRYGTKFFSTGDGGLDSILTTGFEPGYINILYANSGVGKTTFKLYLENWFIEYNMPLLSVNTELRITSTMDKLLCMRHQIPFQSLYPDQRQGQEIPDFIFDKIIEDKASFQRNNRILIVDRPDIDTDDFEAYIKKARILMGLDDKDPLFVTVDLFTLFKDFNGDNKASKSEDVMNKVHYIMRRNNCSMLAVIQSKRPIDKVKVSSRIDLQKFRPSIEEIKNSGAFEERARVVLGLFREKYFAQKTMNNRPELIKVIPDIAEVIILKQNFGSVGDVLKYHFQGECSKYIPFSDEDYKTYDISSMYEEHGEDENGEIGDT